ncbi:MAG: hypothetical protein ACE5I3_04310 [Phycisphaerae bacterium]
MIETPSLEEDAKRVLLQTRNAFAAILEAVPGLEPRAQEVSEALAIPRKLGWQIARAVCETDPFLVARYVPARGGMKTYLQAAAQRNVPEKLIEAATAAVKEFERLIDVHADDRASLEMMLSACASRTDEQADVTWRKAAFMGNSYIWGVRARTQLKAHFLHPAAETGQLDIASLRGFVGLRRMRPNVPWVIARARCSDDDGQVRRAFASQPLDTRHLDEDGTDTVPLLQKFCSKPLPRFRRAVRQYGFLEDELVEGPVGNTGAITCITGEVSRGIASYYRTEHSQHGSVVARMRTPCEALLFDQLVHEDLFGRISPELAIYSQLSGGPSIPYPEMERDRLPVRETVEYLGKGPSVVYTPHVPRYAEMVRYAFDKLGWDGERFDVYRVVLLFPVIPTSVVMRHELPEAPANGESS